MKIRVIFDNFFERCHVTGDTAQKKTKGISKKGTDAIRDITPNADTQTPKSSDLKQVWIEYRAVSYTHLTLPTKRIV